jgi:hypothetical protein
MGLADESINICGKTSSHTLKKGIVIIIMMLPLLES